MASTERPRTPPRSSYKSDSTTSSKKSQGSQPILSFEPHVFDLIHPIREATSLLTKYVPPIFKEAEAVDSSTLLGNGASFSTSLSRIPDGPKTVQHTTNMGGLEITSSSPAPQRPKYVVYKIARVAFDGKGNPLPEYRRAMQSVLTELHALIYPPLFKHLNIIDFLGFAWGSNPFSSSQRLPAIMVEYAEHGTLADLLRNSKVDFTAKHMLCLDIARGIQALHLAGLAHGDVKAENVLICSSANRTYVAKIADFGFSVVQATEYEEIWIG
ncbi:MAG: hypothetical protein Q9214_005077, partial [Letrouitia sp. 1 TL-2023]